MQILSRFNGDLIQIISRSNGFPQEIGIDTMILQQFYYYNDQGTVEPPPDSTAPTDQGSSYLRIYYHVV
jgi:hypothetical protein